MDRKLIDYLRSGKAWVLVGSGPSSAMGYPSWYSFAEHAVKYAENKGYDVAHAQKMLGIEKPNFPEIFEEVAKKITMPVLLSELRPKLKPSNSSSQEIYKIISEWPVPVYLTTNYDDEIQNALVRVGESYLQYDNRREHMALLAEDLSGAIVKIHGDLRSEEGLILTSSQYHAIETGDSFQYWRERMSAIFQMKRIVVIGHSLTDSNIRQVLEIAKKASGVEKPICWIADNVPLKDSIQYLEKYRINVVSYSNTRNRHEGLLPLLKTVSRFVPPRSRIVLEDMSIVKNTPSRASTTALHVYNRSEKKLNRIQVLLAAFEGNYFRIKSVEPFSIATALSESGWASGVPIDSQLEKDFEAVLLDKSYVERVENGYVTTKGGEAKVTENNRKFEHDKIRFLQALRMRASASSISSCVEKSDLESLPLAIEQSLSFFFQNAGLTFATMLNDASRKEIPVCVLEHIRKASTQYSDYNARLLFCSITLDMFCEPKTAEKEYIGRVAEGFLTFHALGVFGVVFEERMRQLASTVWLLDSNILIHLVSEGYTAGIGVRLCIDWLKSHDIRLFTIDSLFEELMGHLKFAFHIISEYGENSTQMMAAAVGSSPYTKSNAFLQGYLEVKARGGVGGWENYCISVFNSTSLSKEAVRDLLQRLGVEVLRFSDWPGFEEVRDYGMQREYECRIVEACSSFNSGSIVARSEMLPRDPYEKAKPEAEALAIVNGERKGHLEALSVEKNDAWFVSDTSVLNMVFDKEKATWPSMSFEMHVASLMQNKNAEDVAFSAVVETIAQSGYASITQDSLTRSFSQLIDEETLSIDRERALLSENLSDKYAESPDKVLERLYPSERPLAAKQLKAEALIEESRRRKISDERAVVAEKKAAESKKLLDKVNKFTLKKLAKKEHQAKRRKNKQRSGTKKKKKKK